MNFSSIDRHSGGFMTGRFDGSGAFARRKDEVRTLLTKRAPSRRLVVQWILAVAISMVMGSVVMAQPQGTFPDAGDLITDSENGKLGDGVPVEAIYLLDGRGKPAFVPGLTYDEYQKVKSGANADSQRYAFKLVTIDVDANDRSADITIRLDITLQPTDGQLVGIPLQMSNFHRIEEPQYVEKELNEKGDADDQPDNSKPDRSGNQFYLSLAPKGKGWMLWARSKSGCELSMTMKATARVTNGTTRSLDFRLPDAASRINISAQGADHFGEVVGRGDEFWEPLPSEGDKSKFKIQSGGGRFTFRWGETKRSKESASLEVSGRIFMRWNSPQDTPIQNCNFTIRNVRGSVSTFKLLLPPGATFLDTPQLASSEQLVEVASSQLKSDGTEYTIIVPAEEQFQQIELSVDVQLSDENYTRAKPLQFRIPTIVGARPDQGKIQIETSDDYRLRWTRSQYIHGLNIGESDNLNTSRRYDFQYDRSEFLLKLWMNQTQRQLRASSTSELRIHDSTAELDMKIQFNGQASDSRSVRVDMAGWEHLKIVSAGSAAGLRWEHVGADLEIDLQNTGNDPPLPITITAQRQLDPQDSHIALSLPRVVKVDDDLVVQNANLVIMGGGRQQAVVDLPKSKGLERLLHSESEDSTDSVTGEMNRFRLVPPGQSALLVAKIVEQSPRVSVAVDGTIALRGRQIETVMNWDLTSESDLGGRLRVSVPSFDVSQSADRVAGDNDTDSQRSESSPDSTLAKTSGADQWTVFVNNRVAILRPLSQSVDSENEIGDDDSLDDLYELISPNLEAGNHEIRWRAELPVMQEPVSREVESRQQEIALPRPVVDDTTIRGDIVFQLSGDESNEIVHEKTSSRTSVALQDFPREPLQMSVLPIKRDQQDLTIRKAVIRTAIGSDTRHEQVLAQTIGGAALTVALSVHDDVMRIQTKVDGEKVEYRRENGSIHIPLPDDGSAHMLDLQVWVQTPVPGALEKVAPIVSLPFGVQKSYWQVILPSDTHVTWAAPSMGRAMTWSFDRWQLARRPLHDDTALINWAGNAESAPMPEGNQYLFTGADSVAFNIRMASRTLMWLWVSVFMLGGSGILTYFPRTRHPVSAIVAGLAFAGLLIVAPDAAVMAGQLAIIGLVLVSVMLSIRTLFHPRPARVLTPTRPVTSEGSTKSFAANRPGSVDPGTADHASVAAVRPVDSASPAVTETQQPFDVPLTDEFDTKSTPDLEPAIAKQNGSTESNDGETRTVAPTQLSVDDDGTLQTESNPSAKGSSIAGPFHGGSSRHSSGTHGSGTHGPPAGEATP